MEAELKELRTNHINKRIVRAMQEIHEVRDKILSNFLDFTKDLFRKVRLQRISKDVTLVYQRR